MTIVRPHAEWIIKVKACQGMVDAFPGFFSQVQLDLFHANSPMSVINTIIDLAGGSRKCKELNSIEALCAPIKTLEGWQKVTYYNTGDVVFVTVPGLHEGQKLVLNIFSLTERLGRVEQIRRAAEKYAKQKIPMASIRKMRKNGKAKGYFKNNN